MSKINNENYILIQGWMVNELNLKGNELLIYAIIYGFSQTENQLYSGSLQYLADWTNSSKQGVILNLKSLISKGLIVKNERLINGVKFCEYYSTKLNGVLKKVEWGIKESLIGGIKESLINNIDINNINNINNNNKEERKKETNYDEILNSMVEDDDVKNTICDYIKMRKLIKKPMTDRAVTMLINKLFKLSNNKQIQIKILEQSILKNWTDIYPYKEENNYAGYQGNVKTDLSKYDR